jgi:hypothetical protein
MITVRFLVASMLFALSSIATASVRMDENAGTWRDNFTDLAGLVQNRQGAFFSPSGYTVDPAVQRWSQPFSTTGMYDSFSASTNYADPPVRIMGKGSNAEYLTLWNQIYEPGDAIKYASYCETYYATGPNVWECDGAKGFLPNGWHTQSVSGVPYHGTETFNAVGYDTQPGSYLPDDTCGTKNPCKIPLHLWGLTCTKDNNCGTVFTPSIGRFHDVEPILEGPGEKALVAGDGYGITYLVSAQTKGCHKTCTNIPYLRFEACEQGTNTVAGQTIMYESSLDLTGGLMSTNYASMIPFSIRIKSLPGPLGGVWDFRAYSEVSYLDPATKDHNHCTALGPVWAVADKGTYTSPVLDTMSDTTRWVSIGWKMEQSTQYCGSGISCKDSVISPIPEGSPITPIKIAYYVGNDSQSLPFINTVKHGGEEFAGVIGMNTVDYSSTVFHYPTWNPVSVSGRYFRYEATLYSRHAAEELDSDLAPYPANIYFGAFLPALKELYVTYFVTVARAISVPVAPRCCIKRWRTLNYVVEKPLGTRVEVGVTAPDGSLLLANVAPGADLSVINPFTYPAIALCATLYCDPADYTRRPVLKAWEIQWDPDGNVIHMYDVAGGGTFKGNGIHPARGEEFKMQVCVRQSGHASVEVHDAAGQLIRKLLDEDSAPGVRIITWNGRNERGEIVAAGVYFVSARVPGGQQVRRLAVIR